MHGQFYECMYVCMCAFANRYLLNFLLVLKFKERIGISHCTYNPNASSSAQCIPPLWPCTQIWPVLGLQGCDEQPTACR